MYIGIFKIKINNNKKKKKKTFFKVNFVNHSSLHQ